MAGVERLGREGNLRKPQDHFQRVWSTAFRGADLAAAADTEDDTTTEDSGKACS